MLVSQLHRLPLESPELVKRLDFYPLNILHRSYKAGNAFDVGGIVRVARHQSKPHPNRLSELSESFGKPQSWGQFALGNATIDVRVRAFDIEQRKIEVR